MKAFIRVTMASGTDVTDIHRGSDFVVPEEKRIIILGKTGNGKSETGNTILKCKKFYTDLSASSVTQFSDYGTVLKDIKFKEIERYIRLKVVDTPGFFDNRPNVEHEKFQDEIVKGIGFIAPGPHAVLYVLKIGVITNEEIETTRRMLNLCGEDIYNFIIIVFTYCNYLKQQEKTIDAFIRTLPSKFEEFYDKCGKRVICIDNFGSEDEKDKAIYKLMKLIVEMEEREMEKKYFYNKILIDFNVKIQEMTADLMKKNPELSELDAREIALDNIKLKGKLFKTLKRIFIGAVLLAVGAIGITIVRCIIM